MCLPSVSGLPLDIECVLLLECVGIPDAPSCAFLQSLGFRSIEFPPVVERNSFAKDSVFGIKHAKEDVCASSLSSQSRMLGKKKMDMMITNDVKMY